MVEVKAYYHRVDLHRIRMQASRTKECEVDSLMHHLSSRALGPFGRLGNLGLLFGEGLDSSASSGCGAAFLVSAFLVASTSIPFKKATEVAARRSHREEEGGLIPDNGRGKTKKGRDPEPVHLLPKSYQTTFA